MTGKLSRLPSYYLQSAEGEKIYGVLAVGVLGLLFPIFTVKEDPD